MNKLTNFLLIISFCLSSFFAFAINGNNWDVYYEDAKVKISYQKEICDFDNQFNQEFVFLRIENLTSNFFFTEIEIVNNHILNEGEIISELNINNNKINSSNFILNNDLNINMSDKFDLKINLYIT